MRVYVNGRVYDDRKGDTVVVEMADRTDLNFFLAAILMGSFKRLCPSTRPALPGTVEAVQKALGPAPSISEAETAESWKFVDRIREGAKR